MAEKKPSKEEIEKQREGMRKAALVNMKGSIGNRAAFYLIKKSSDQFGKAVIQATDHFVYRPSISPEELYDKFFSSRDDGEPGSEFLRGSDILNDAYGIFQQSLPVLKLNDIYELMGSKAKDGGDVYLMDMPKEKVQAVVEMYQNHLMYSRVAKATGETAKKIPGDLEKLLTEEPKQSGKGK